MTSSTASVLANRSILSTRLRIPSSIRLSGPFLQQTGDPVAAQQLALQALANLREQQASALAYFDVFWVLAVVMVALVFVVLLMKRSVAEKGARIGSE